MQDPLEMSGKVVIVTGGSQGVGRGIARRFLEAGAEVVICDIKEPEELPSACERQALFNLTDVRDVEQIERTVDFVTERFGRLDVLVNNAGGAPTADAATASPRFSEAIIRLNLIAPLDFAQKANAAKGRVAFLFPLKGFSMLDSEGELFWWPEADRAMFEAVEKNIKPGIKVVELDCNINDEAFSEKEYNWRLAEIDRQLKQACCITNPPIEKAAELFSDISMLWSEATLEERRRLVNTLLEMVYVDLETKQVAALKPTPAFGSLLGKAIKMASDKPVFLTPFRKGSVGVGGDGGELNSPSKKGYPGYTTSLVNSFILLS